MIVCGKSTGFVDAGPDNVERAYESVTWLKNEFASRGLGSGAQLYRRNLCNVAVNWSPEAGPQASFVDAVEMTNAPPSATLSEPTDWVLPCKAARHARLSISIYLQRHTYVLRMLCHLRPSNAYFNCANDLLSTSCGM
jgi:hypothetical protein